MLPMDDASFRERVISKLDHLFELVNEIGVKVAVLEARDPELRISRNSDKIEDIEVALAVLKTRVAAFVAIGSLLGGGLVSWAVRAVS